MTYRSVRHAALRLVAAAPPIAITVVAWAAIEVESSGRAFGIITVTCLACAVPASAAQRGLIAITAVLLFVASRVGSTPGEVRTTVSSGARDAFSAAPPIDASTHPDLHVLVLFAALGFGLGIAILAPSRPFGAAAVTTAGIGWPIALQPTRNTVAIGSMLLIAAFWPVAVRVGNRCQGLVPGLATVACVVVAAGAVVGLVARPSTAALAWQNWTLFGDERAANTVALVWDANYNGIEFPAQKTTVLRIAAPRRSLYWRAATLDSFAGDRWIQSPIQTGSPGLLTRLPADPLLPEAAQNQRAWVKQTIEVRALVGDSIVASSQPMKIDAGVRQRIRPLAGGVLQASGGLGQMRTYTVWSYVPQPTPTQLLEVEGRYPISLDRYLDIGRTVVPGYAVQGRVTAIDALFADSRYQDLRPYQGLWQTARRITAKARSPYEATVALERWLRSSGGFTYDEHPPAIAGAPPLTYFVTAGKRGYCQHFAGAMALMLRYLGIPAKVAVGFSNGDWHDGRWTVTDHDAHAWVEVWFAGYGWLPFDPTPGRGSLTATYTNASDSADAIRALGTGRFLDLGSLDQTPSPARGAPSLQVQRSRRSAWPYLAPLVVITLIVIGFAAFKRIVRRRRYPHGDARNQAAATRAELAGFVRDQGSRVAATASVDELAVVLRGHGVGSDAFARAFVRARYGPMMGADIAAADAQRELQKLLRVLRERLGPGKRLRGFFAIRSLRDG